MSKYGLKISIIADENTSLNEFHATLVGSDLNITDAVMSGESIDELLNRQELEELKSGRHDRDNLEFTKKTQHSRGGNNNRDGRNNRSSSSGRSANSGDRRNQRQQRTPK